jgi:hypothetical protein
LSSAIYSSNNDFEEETSSIAGKSFNSDMIQDPNHLEIQPDVARFEPRSPDPNVYRDISKLIFSIYNANIVKNINSEPKKKSL